MNGKKTEKLRIFAFWSGGLLVGAANGIFGGGGGMLLVPLLSFGARLNEKESHATAIAIILPLCVVTAVFYSLFGSSQWAYAGICEVGVIIGGLSGALLLKKLPRKIINVIFYLLMLAAGIRMVI